MVKTLQYMSLSQVYPAVLAGFNLNTCGDPDCGNFGVAPDFTIPVFKGKNAAQRKQVAAASIPALTTGLGSYTMSSDDGPVAVWCRSFDSIMCSKGDELWAREERMNSARMQCELH